MGYTCKDQALLVAISSRGNHVLGVFGDEAKSEIDWYEGEIDQFLSPEGVEDDGLYVWEGEIRCGFKEPNDTTWHGTWRPARVGDLERFGLRGLETASGDQDLAEELAKWKRACEAFRGEVQRLNAILADAAEGGAV